MKHSILNQAVSLLALAAVAHGAAAETRTGPYLGEKPPGLEPVLFAPGVISTDVEELNSVFSPDGREFAFARAAAPAGSKDPNFQMYTMRLGTQRWEAPVLFPANGPSFDMDMEYSNDGNRLYWVGLQPVDGKMPQGMRMYYSDRKGNGWGPAQLGPEAVNALDMVLYPSITADNAMYFPARAADSLGGTDIYRSEFRDGKYQKPVNIGAPVNTRDGESDLVVARDGSYMIVSSRREGGQGEGDLYISFRQPDGRWGALRNMGAGINSDKSEYCPKLSHDGKYLFFTSQRTGSGDIYWVDARVIDKFRP
jgi:Tol biopolymer transport system component